jgi:PAS domain S-box-containing protein
MADRRSIESLDCPSSLRSCESSSGSPARDGFVEYLAQDAAGRTSLALLEGRFRCLAQVRDEITWTSGPDGRQDRELPEWQAFTGQSREEVEGFGWANAIHPEDREYTIERWQEAIRSGRTFEIEQRLRRKDGVYRHMLVRAVPVRDDSGQIAEWVGVHSDITERKQLAESLRQRERDLTEAHRIARLGTWSWNIADDTVVWSDEVYRVFEIDPALPAPGYGQIAALHPPDSRAELAAAVRRAVEIGEPYALDVELFLPSGKKKWITSRGEVETWIDGKPAKLRGTIQEITERKLHEQQLSQAHETLARVLNSITDGVALLDRDWRYTYVSPHAARMLGIAQESLLGACIWDVFPNAFDTKFYRCFHEAVERREPVHFEEYYGEPLHQWLECHCYPSAEGLSVYFRDITEQKQAEDKKQESEARFRRMYESDLIGIGFPDRHGAIHDCNDALLRIVGYTREDLRAGLIRWDAMTPPEYRELDLLHIAESAELGCCTPYEKEYIRKDGSRVPILCGFARFSESQQGSIGFVLDLSAQKEAEAGLRKREQQFRALAESLPQLVWVTDGDGANTYCNQRMLVYTGLSVEEMTGLDWPPKILHPDDLEPTLERWLSCVRSGQPYQCEYRLRRHDGAFRHFLARAVPVRDDDGAVDRWIGSSTDIHDRRLAEEALRRTEKLAATARLAASVAHEINNPLAGVTNSIYLALQDPDLSDSARGYLKLADQELKRVAQAATQTLRFHRQSTGPGFADLGEIMDSAFAIFASRFEACAIALDREYLAFESLYCYRDELRQVFANLLSNSLDACAAGGRVRIRIRTRRLRSAARCSGIAVTVADTGKGIPPEIRKNIFEPFITTKGTTGTGLGLWLTEDIVRKHRGRISVKSRFGSRNNGTVFSLFFPFDGLPRQTAPSLTAT